MKHYIIVFIFISFSSFSQENLTLEGAIEYAISNSYDIAIIKNDAEIIKNSTHPGLAGVLPSIIVSSGYNGSVNDSELKFNSFLDFGDENSFSDIEASEAQSSNISSSIGLNYRLFNGFSGIYTLKKFKSQKLMADENVRYQIESKIIEVIQQYYELLNTQNIHSTFKTRYQISLDRYNRDLQRYESGSISKLNLLNSELNLNTDEVNMKEAVIALNTSQLMLSLLLNIPDTSLVLEHSFEFNNNLNIDTLLNNSILNNASILIAELNYSIAQHELKISKSNFSPTIDLFSSYSYNNRQSETSFISKQTDYGIVAGVNMEIPIFTGNIKRKSYQNAKINLASKNYSLDKIKETIKTTLLTTYFTYTKGLENLELIKKNLETITQAANINKDLYDMGQITNLEFRESQFLLDQAEINYSAKLSQAKIQEYIIYQLSGQLQAK